MKKFECNLLLQLYSNLYPVSMQEVWKRLEREEVTFAFVGGNQTRWQSSKEATGIVWQILPGLLGALPLQARKEPTAQGLFS